MGRIIKISYLDTVVFHPELSEKELDALIREEEERCKQMTEWDPM